MREVRVKDKALDELTAEMREMEFANKHLKNQIDRYERENENLKRMQRGNLLVFKRLYP